MSDQTSLLVFVLALIFGLMLAEARLSSRNQKVLRGRGAIMPAGDVYAPMSVIYPAAFLAMGVEGVWRASHADRGGESGLFAAGVLLFAASKALKYWAIHALGDRWSFRVLVVPGEPLVTSGPYEYVAHPNYVAVVGELLGTAMMMEAWLIGPVVLAAFGVILWLRIRFETGVLRQAYQKSK